MKKKKQFKSALSGKSNRNGYLFLAPWLIGFVLFTLIPFVYTFYLSFNNVSQTGLGYELTWVGLRNYHTAFFKVLEFVPALFNFTIMQLLYVPTILVISFILGLLLNQEIPFRAVFRTIFFLPVIILSGTVMQQFMESGATSLSAISDMLVFTIIANYSPILARVIEVLFINFTMVLWFTGIPIILFINAFQKIDRGLFEASQIDGASWWQILWKIIIPMTKSTALVVSIYTIVNLGLYNINPLGNGAMSIFDMIRNAMNNSSTGLGIASAYAAIYTVIVLLLIFIALLIFRDRSDKKVKMESLQERQVRRLRRMQQRNIRRNMTVKEYLSSLRKDKGEEH